MLWVLGAPALGAGPSSQGCTVVSWGNAGPCRWLSHGKNWQNFMDERSSLEGVGCT